MSDKKYQVFVSSTFTDLIEERKKILNVLLMADCIPAGMEAFVASDTEQFEVIKKVIDLCDYYVLIIGMRYGSISPSTNLSYTEMEYNYAIEKEIPVLVFAINENVNLTKDRIEIDSAKIEKLTTFRNKALGNRLASTWETTDDLIGKLAISIMKAKNEIPRPGWQRGLDFDEISLRRDMMQLQKENESLEKQLSDAKTTIDSLTIQENIAFDGYEIPLDYSYNEQKFQNGGFQRMHYEREISVLLPEIFSVIAIEMLDVAISEEVISTSLINKFCDPEHSCSFNDSQIIKKILNQLKALNMVKSNWNAAKNTLFWKLTPIGEKIKNDMLLIKNETTN